MKPGSRVGAILSADAATVYLFGYGVYEGEDIPASGWMHDAKITNPKIRLDNGKTVWGYQCWWGLEDYVKAQCSGREVVIVETPDEQV